MNNSSLLTADRTTHVKVVVVALVYATVIAAIGVASHMTAGNGLLEATAPVATPAKPLTASAGEAVIR